MLYQTRRSHAIGVLGLLVLLLFVPFSFYSLFIASFHLLILFLTLSISLPFLSIFYLLLISFQFSNCLLKKLEKKFQYTIITYSEEVCHEYYPVFCFFFIFISWYVKTEVLILAVPVLHKCYADLLLLSVFHAAVHQVKYLS